MILFVVCIVFGFRYRTVHVKGCSMSPTYEDGDWTVIEKPSSLGKNWKPERLDVVLASDQGELICKRVIGLEGDSIEIKNGDVYLNEKKFDDPFGQGKIVSDLVNENDDKLRFISGPKKGQYATIEINEHKVIIPKGYVWVVGDNRKNSWYGVLSIKNIKGLLII